MWKNIWIIWLLNKKSEVDEVAYTSIILHLSDQILRKVLLNLLDYNLEAFSKLVHENLNTREKVSEYKGMDTLTPEIIINYLKSKEELKSTKAKNNNF